MKVTTTSPIHAGILAALHAESFVTPWNEKEFAALLSLPGALGLIAGEDPRGFVLARTAADEAEILTIAVSPGHRRAGIGALLLERLRSDLRDQQVGKIFLEVAADNAAALALYHGAGFTPCGRRPGYYASGARDAMLMMLNLSTA